MKKIDFGKAMNTIGIILILVLALLYFDSCSNKSAKRQQDTYDTLTYIAEELNALSDKCFEAHDSGNYSKMDDALYDAYKKCDELNKLADNLAYQYKERDYDGR